MKKAIISCTKCSALLSVIEGVEINNIWYCEDCVPKTAKQRLQEWVDGQVANNGLIGIGFCSNLTFAGQSKEDFIKEQLQVDDDKVEEVCQSILNMLEAEERGDYEVLAKTN